MKSQQHTLVVESLANSGDGVGRIEGKVVFIPFACPGDKLLVEITQDKKSFLKAKIIKVLEPSGKRVTPLCPVFGKCGGCDWQHIQYEEQLRWKHENLKSTLQKIGKIEDTSIIAETVGSPREFHYRNRIQVHRDRKGVYYYAKGSHRPVYIDQCPIADEKINSALADKKFLASLKSAKVELAIVEGQAQAYTVNKVGQSELGFRQVNSVQNAFLVEKTVDFIEKAKVRNVFDLYCGQGNWARALNKKSPDIDCVGIDINPINIKKAKAFENETLKFIEGDVTTVFPSITAEIDLIIIDPPRAGCSTELLESLDQKRSKWLIYISCHPATLARDIHLLQQHSWDLVEVTPVDMFPQTAHLESWCLLRSAR